MVTFCFLLFTLGVWLLGREVSWVWAQRDGVTVWGLEVKPKMMRVSRVRPMSIQGKVSCFHCNHSNTIKIES